MGPGVTLGLSGNHLGNPITFFFLSLYIKQRISEWHTVIHEQKPSFLQQACTKIFPSAEVQAMWKNFAKVLNKKTWN